MNITIDKLLKFYLEKNRKNKLLNENNYIVTHEQLEIESNKMANYLISKGLKKNDRVALLVDLHISTIILIFGIIKVGGIYVPIDVNYPDETVYRILESIEAKFIFYTSKYQNKMLPEIVEKIGVPFDDGEFTEYKEYSEAELEYTSMPKDLVYIAFTSGTTGMPKGVMMSHISIMTFMDYVTRKMHHGVGVKSLCRTPVSFDPFLTELLPSVISGGQVYIQSRDASFRKLLKFIEKYRITNFGCGPSLLYLFADNLETVKMYDISCIEEIYIGYEKCPVNIIKILQNEFPHITFFNGYGTTETFASSTFYPIENLNDYPDVIDIPLGKAIEGEKLIIVNEEGRECEIDEVGEIIIKGCSLFNGYWKNIPETEKRLRVDPTFENSGEKVYFTGDLAVRRNDNNIYFIGRKDEQVKIRGYRVELGEIKYVIEQYNNIKECDLIYSNGHLYCFYNYYKQDENGLDIVKEICSKKLSPFKIPDKWIYLENFPRSSNGKILKKKLFDCIKNRLDNKTVEEKKSI